MGELAGLTERLHVARSRWRTARIVQTHWVDTDLWLKAHHRPDQGMAVFTARAEPATAVPNPLPYRYWFDPDRLRMRMEVDHPQPWRVVKVDDPDCFENELLEPAWLLSETTLELPGAATTLAGRPGRHVRAVPRPNADDMRWAGGADEVLVVVDDERGILLRVEKRLEGAPFMVTELVEVELDAAFPDDLFTALE